ncbi:MULTISPECIES: patatin-like phospholipase family protein [Aeromonas]|uniref:patatin-like phospholipase family protein n=1 Tax=Aeromonas TaxID=642 RepID=UPI001B33531E|nr:MULTISPECIES: patatin-like phospholipase family protein [Aeromonas]MBP4040337.1 patatin-like phospholipase family protein [Aeromonas sp. SrichE-2G]MCO4203420.1 patatin-like phospholipase family protein [Aeromonas taiwanensis]
MARPNTALLLTGGGARAAYQVGVLKAVAELYPRNIGIPFPILCGTSAGALNITALACYASCFHLGVRKLEWVWRRFETHHIFDFHPCQLLWRTLYQGSAGLITPQSNRAFHLFDNAPLRRLLDQLIDYHRIDDNILYGSLEAIAITASDYDDGLSTTFFQGRAEHQPWERARRRGLRTLLTSDHLMASAALPFVFPATAIGDRVYGDGSIHQLSPLSPAIHLGAERILLVTLDSPHGENPTPRQGHLTSSNIAGHLLNTIFSDTLNSDLERLGRINQTLSLIPARERSRLKLRQVETCVIRPSQDLDLIALDYLPRLPTQLRRLLRVLGVNGEESSSLASFLMFDPGYCQRLIKLGYQDALAQRQRIEDFLDLPGQKEEARLREGA